MPITISEIPLMISAIPPIKVTRRTLYVEGLTGPRDNKNLTNNKSTAPVIPTMIPAPILFCDLRNVKPQSYLESEETQSFVTISPSNNDFGNTKIVYKISLMDQIYPDLLFNPPTPECAAQACHPKPLAWARSVPMIC
jgi:hypothetical protein